MAQVEYSGFTDCFLALDMPFPWCKVNTVCTFLILIMNFVFVNLVDVFFFFFFHAYEFLTIYVQHFVFVLEQSNLHGYSYTRRLKSERNEVP